MFCKLMSFKLHCLFFKVGFADAIKHRRSNRKTYASCSIFEALSYKMSEIPAFPVRTQSQKRIHVDSQERSDSSEKVAVYFARNRTLIPRRKPRRKQSKKRYFPFGVSFLNGLSRDNGLGMNLFVPASPSSLANRFSFSQSHCSFAERAQHTRGLRILLSPRTIYYGGLLPVCIVGNLACSVRAQTSRKKDAFRRWGFFRVTTLSERNLLFPQISANGAQR